MKKLASLLLAFICLQATAQLSLGAFRLSDQGSWSSLSDERLEELSLDFLLVKDMPDSALLVDRLLTSRLRQRNPMTFLQRRMLALSLNRMAYLYSFSFFDYKHAIESLHEADTICNDPDVRPFIDLNIGHIYSLYTQCYPTPTNVQTVRHFYKKAFIESAQMGNYTNMISAFVNFWNLGFDDANIKDFSHETALFRQIKIPASEPYYDYATAVLRAIDLVKAKKYTAAAAELQKKMLSHPTTTMDVRITCSTAWSMACIYKLAQMPDSVYKYASILDYYGREKGLQDLRFDAAILLHYYYLATGNKEKADAYYHSYLQFRNSFFGGLDIETYRDGFLAPKANDILPARKPVQAEARFTQNQTLMMIFGGLVLLALGGYLMRRYLYHKNEHLRFKLELPDALTPKAEPAPVKSLLEDNEKDLLQAKIKKVLTDEQEICREDFSIDRLAKLCEATPKDVSQVINERMGCSFVLLLSEYRIKEACRRLDDEENFGRLTLEAIGRSVGFKARESFSRAFKRVTGVSPSVYQRRVSEKQS